MGKSSAKNKKKSKSKKSKLATRIPQRVKLLSFLAVACLSSFVFRLFNSHEKIPDDDFLEQFRDTLVKALENEKVDFKPPVLSTTQTPSLTKSPRRVFPEYQYKELETSRKPAKTDNPKIFFWKIPWQPWTHNLNNCGKNSDCDLLYPDGNTSKMDLLRQSQIVVFMPVFSKTLAQLIPKLNKNRRPDQYFVFFQWEAPNEFHNEKDQNLSAYNNFFNATLTFRSDSDYLFPYGGLIQTYMNALSGAASDDVLKSNFVQSFPEKTHGVAVMISNCKVSYRNEIIRKLQKLLATKQGSSYLDIYGDCRSVLEDYLLVSELIPELDSIENHDDSEMITYLSRYKFVLAFENSKCQDYISEKLWRNAIAAKAVPIVAGTKRETYEEFLPADAFIHVDDFGSVEDLAQFLMEYLKNDDGYKEKFFSWYGQPDNVRFSSIEEYQEKGLCGLCGDAKELKSQNVENKIVNNLNLWWYYDQNGVSVCEN